MSSFVGLAASLGNIYYMSKDAFEWKWQKSLILTVVYLVSSIGVGLASASMSA